MKLGYIGLGKMGYNMAELLLEKGHQIVAYNRGAEPVKKSPRGGRSPRTRSARWSRPSNLRGWSGSWSPTRQSTMC